MTRRQNPLSTQDVSELDFYSPTKSSLISLYSYLSSYAFSTFPELATNEEALLVGQEAFKFSIKTIFYTSTLSANYLAEVADCIFSKQIRPESELAFLYGPELMMHLPRDIISAGKYHVDCNDGINNYFTAWTPLFSSSYRQLSFKYDETHIQPFLTAKNKMLLFPGNIQHKGNYNYTTKDHCALVVRVTFDHPSHVGKYIVARRVGPQTMLDNTAYPTLRWRLCELKLLFVATFQMLSQAVASELGDEAIVNYLNKLPHAKAAAYWYSLYFSYSYWADFLDIFGLSKDSISKIQAYAKR